jgi:membrane-associated protein
MSDSASALHFVTTYGYPVLALLLFLASVGLPLPVAIVLVALGAVSAQSSALSLPLLIVLGTLASVAGDLLPYGLGRVGGPRLLGWLRSIRHGILAKPLDRAQGQLQRHGAGMIFLSRFALTAIATPVALLGGVSRLRLRSFLTWDVLGEAVFVLSNLAVGRLFGAAIIGNETLANLLWLALALVALAPVLLPSVLRRIISRHEHIKRQAGPGLLRLPDAPDPLTAPPSPAHAA